MLRGLAALPHGHTVRALVVVEVDANTPHTVDDRTVGFQAVSVRQEASGKSRTTTATFLPDT